MASPQLENGYTRIANELMDALMRTNLSAYESRVLWAIWRKTYGFQKKDDWLSNTQLVQVTGLRKQHVSRTIRKLITRNIITKLGYKVAFNKDYTQWRELPKQVTVTNSGYKVTSTGVKSNQFRGTQKKKIIKKDNAPAPDVRVAIDYFSSQVEKFKGFKPKIAVKDAALAKRELKNRSIDDLNKQIDFFLSSEKANQHITLAAALSVDTYNLFLAKQSNTEHLTPIEAYKRREGLI